MNNETNNNLNNQGNPSGINFVQGGTPSGPVTTSTVPPVQPTYTVPVEQPAAPAPMPAPVTPTVETVQPQPVTPQPVSPQPLEQPQMNFVSFNPQVTNDVQTPQPVPTPPVAPTVPNAAPITPTPAPGPMPTPMVTPNPNMGPMPGPMTPGGMPPTSMPNTQNTGAPLEEEKPKLPILMIIITVLVVAGVAVFLIFYLTGKIDFGGGSKNNTQNTANLQSEIVLADWMNYLLNQDTTEIRINRYIDADNSKSVSLNKDELKKLFTKMKDYTLTKYYSISQIVSNDDLQVTYSKNGNTYNFVLSGENVSIGDDSGILEIFESDSIPIEDDGQASRDSEDYNYILKNFDVKIYDEYFSEN